MFLRTASARCSSEQRRSEEAEEGDWLSPSLPRNRLPNGLTEANDRLFAREGDADADADADGLGAVKQLFFRSVMLSSSCVRVTCAQPARDKCGKNFGG